MFSLSELISSLKKKNICLNLSNPLLFIYFFFYYTYSFRYDINMTSRRKILFVQRKERIAIESFSNWNGIDCQDWHSIFDVSIWFRHFDVIPLWYHIVEIELSVKSSIFGKIYYSDHFPFYNYDYLYISNYLPIV